MKNREKMKKLNKSSIKKLLIVYKNIGYDSSHNY